MKKFKLIFISVALCLMLGFATIVPSLFIDNLNLPTRDINVDNIGTLSYSEKVDELLSNFSSYSVTSEGKVVCFEAESEVDLNSLSQLSFVSSTETPITKKYNTRLDIENEKFYIIIKYVQNGEIINEEEIETEPYYEEYEDDYYLILPDGTKASVKTLLAEDNLDECMVMTATATSCAVALLAATVIVMAPVVTKVAVTVVTAVVTWVKSFVSWFKSLFTKKTTYVTTTTVVTTLTPAISVAGSKIETKAMTKAEVQKLKVNVFYLCFADPTNGKMYVSLTPISYDVALMVMSTPILVPCIGKDSKDMIASVFTINQTMALEIASAAGLVSPYPECHGADYYMHYHSVVQAKTRQGTWARPHAFFLYY